MEELRKHKITLTSGEWIEVEEREQGRFVVVDDSMTVKGGCYLSDCTDLGFCSWDETVQDLDDGQSDEAQCFGMSCYLKWNEVHCTPEGFDAPSLERLSKALEHINICSWCPGDI